MSYYDYCLRRPPDHPDYPEEVYDERKYTPVFSQFQPGVVVGYERIEEREDDDE